MNKRIPAAVAGIVVLGAALGLGAGTASAASTAGTLDSNFGHGGIVLANLGLDANGNQIQAIPGAVAPQSNGDIVVAVGIGGPDTGLARFLPNGTRDTTFGTGGFAALPDIGIGSTRPGLAVQSDGKLVWAGERPRPTGRAPRSRSSGSTPTAPWTRVSARAAWPPRSSQTRSRAPRPSWCSPMARSWPAARSCSAAGRR